MSPSYISLKNKVGKMSNVTTKPMFGYQCFSILGKFFVGFSNKNNFQVIVRLSKEQQGLAVKNKGIKPFSHGGKMGWIEIDMAKNNTKSAFKWITRGYDYAKSLTKD